MKGNLEMLGTMAGRVQTSRAVVTKMDEVASVL